MVEIDKIINQTLAELSINIEILDSKKIEYLRKIENVINNRFIIREQVNENNKKNRPTISNITLETDISRATIYNHSELKNYIEFRINEYDKDDYFKKIEQLVERNRELEETINKMMKRDVNIELMRRKIKQLEADMKLLKKEKIEFQKKYENLRKKV